MLQFNATFVWSSFSWEVKPYLRIKIGISGSEESEKMECSKTVGSLYPNTHSPWVDIGICQVLWFEIQARLSKEETAIGVQSLHCFTSIFSLHEINTPPRRALPLNTIVSTLVHGVLCLIDLYVFMLLMLIIESTCDRERFETENEEKGVAVYSWGVDVNSATKERGREKDMFWRFIVCLSRRCTVQEKRDQQ